MEQWKRLVPAILLLFFFAIGSVFSQSADDKRQIHRILDLFEKSNLEEDMGMLEEILSDSGYLMVVRKRDDPGNANVLSKEQLLGGMRHKWRQEDYLEHRHTKRRIEFHGPVAELRSVIINNVAGQGKSTQNSYHICAREEGRWKVVFTSFLLAD